MYILYYTIGNRYNIKEVNEVEVKTNKKIRMELEIHRAKTGRIEKIIVGDLSLLDKLKNVWYKIRGVI